MELDSYKVRQAEEQLLLLLGPEIAQITQAIKHPLGKDNPFLIEIPDAHTIDLSMEDLLSLVARCSNAYGRIARFAGMARADMKILKARYDRTYKRAKHGSNEAEREKNAMEAALDEHIAAITAEAISEIASSLEDGARIASESARKLLQSLQNQQIANSREEKGAHRAEEYQPF